MHLNLIRHLLIVTALCLLYLGVHHTPRLHTYLKVLCFGELRLVNPNTVYTEVRKLRI